MVVYQLGVLHFNFATSFMLQRRGRKNRRSGRRQSGGRGVATSFNSPMRTISTVYRFRLADNNNNSNPISSNGSGVITGYQNCDPSGGSGSTWTASEWSTLISLFSEVRLVEAYMYFIPVSPEDTKLSGTTPGNTLCISTTDTNLSAAPTTMAQAWDNADSKLYNLTTSRSTFPLRIRVKPRSRVTFASVTAASPGPYAGCTGGIQYYGDNFPISTVVGYIKNEGIYEFRGRI